MIEKKCTINSCDAFVVQPCFMFSVILLIVLNILNAQLQFGSFDSLKIAIVFAFFVTLFVVSFYSLKHLILLYVGGAILQGFSFLVPPTAIEQKLFFSYFFVESGALKVYLADLFLLVSVVTLGLRLIMFNSILSQKFLNERISKSVAVFICIGGVIGLMSVHIYGKSALGEARIVWYAFFYFIAAHYFRSVTAIILFFRFFVFATLIRSVLNFLTVFIYPAYLSYDRPFGSNADAAYCALSFLLIFSLGKQLIGNNLIRKATLFWLGIFPILITSRSTFLCLVLTLMIYGVIAKEMKPKKIFGFFITAILLGAVSVYFVFTVPQLHDLFEYRFISLFRNYQDDPTGNWRLLGWIFAIQSVKDNLFLGVGFGGYAERFIDGKWIKVSLHNAYMDYLYTMGLSGLLPFIYLLGYSLFSLKRTFFSANNLMVNNLKICIFCIIVFCMMFIGLNGEMNNASSGTVMWIFLGMVPFLKHFKTDSVNGDM